MAPLTTTIVEMSAAEIDTPSGPARVRLTRADRSTGLVLLGHGAGGGVDAPDLRAVTDALVGAGISVGLTEQPYRVAGKRAPAPAARLDEAMSAIVAAVRTGDEPLVLGGRSSGARVACRTASACGARGVLALAFPLRPPWRPDSTRLPELESTGVPVLAVQGDRDHFGTAADLISVAPAHVTVLTSAGADHGLARALDLPGIVAWVRARLTRSELGGPDVSA